MAEARQKKILSVRLGLLEEQRDRLSSVVSHRVNKVIQLGRSWLEGRKTDSKGKTFSYKEMSELIEDTDMLLAQQLEKLSDEDQEAFNKETAGDTSTSSSHGTATASQTVENQIQQTITPTTAVTAYVENITRPEVGNIIDKWRCLAGNTGVPFDVNTGIFTAPVAGTYAVALSMYQKKEGKIWLRTKKTPSGSNPSVAVAVTDRHNSNSCDFSMVDMSVGDKLYVDVWSVDDSPTLHDCKFSIFLVK